jgi:GxxExxY protein
VETEKTGVVRGGRAELPLAWERVTGLIIEAAIEVHRCLGPGLLEKLYEEAMVRELRLRGRSLERQVRRTVLYKGEPIGEHVIDLLVDGLVVVELKAQESVTEVHKAQLLSYLRATDLPLGLLLNFHVPKLIDGLTRRINQHSSLFATSAPLTSSATPVRTP